MSTPPNTLLGLGFADYRESRELGRDDPSFAAIIAAALRKADAENAALLRRAFPRIAADLQARYDSPGGRLPGEVPEARA